VTAQDRVIDLALEYESMTLMALRVLVDGTSEELFAACLRWASVVRDINRLSTEDYSTWALFLTERANIPADAYATIAGAMGEFMDYSSTPTRH
jgi:hypothetical protein